MRVRDAVLLYQETEKDTDTKTLDIDLPDPISALDLEVECTNGSVSNKGNYISDIVPKIEVVDGSDVLVSLSLAQLQALQFYKTGKTPTMFPSEWPGGIQRETVKLLFGRYLWDPAYALVPRQYRNPQLKVTFNKAAIRAAASDGFATGDNIKLTVAAKIMEEGASPQGFMMQKQIDSFTSAASGEKRIDLPTDYPYRLLMLRAWLQLKDIDELISQIKLTVDTDKFIPFNRYVKQLDAEALATFGVGCLKHDIFCSDNEAVRILFNKEPDCRPFDAHATLPDILGIIYQWSSELKLTMATHAGAADTTDRKVTLVEEGHALHATLPIIFGLMMDPTTWLNPRGWTKFEAVLTQAAVSGAISIVAEQIRGA